MRVSILVIYNTRTLPMTITYSSIFSTKCLFPYHCHFVSLEAPEIFKLIHILPVAESKVKIDAKVCLNPPKIPPSFYLFISQFVVRYIPHNALFHYKIWCKIYHLSYNEKWNQILFFRIISHCYQGNTPFLTLQTVIENALLLN